MNYYKFRQNNSFGNFKGPYFMVFVQANSPEEANDIVLNYGKYDVNVYFDGVHKGFDCDCCGDRWSEACKYSDSFDTIEDIRTYCARINNDCYYTRVYERNVMNVAIISNAGFMSFNLGDMKIGNFIG